MTREEIIAKAESFEGGWYHRIELTPGYFTPSVMEASWPIWDTIRHVRERLDYHKATVLDLGTMDGMWAFEAEKLGARQVIAGDIWQYAPTAKNRFHFARQCLDSEASLWDLNVQDLYGTLSEDHQFRIVQCLGLLYHVQNPMLALHNVAMAMTEASQMILETAVMHKETGPWMRFNSDNGIYCDATTFWCPTMDCLHAMLDTAGLKTDGAIERLKYGVTDRICAIVVRNGKPLDPKLGME
jgi:tRNA (mo5U34)-methyltransferase